MSVPTVVPTFLYFREIPTRDPRSQKAIRPSHWCFRWRLSEPAVDLRQLGLIGLGQEAEALRVLEAGFNGFSYFDAVSAILRGQLYEKRGEREKAIRAYTRAVDLWRDCDPEFRPRWETAERALNRLLAES